jgi:hypothetical protein
MRPSMVKCASGSQRRRRDLDAGLVETTRHTESDDPHLRSTQDVTGHTIQAKDGEIGHVEDFVVDDETWAIRCLIVDTRNRWPGKEVLISTRWIERVSWEESKVFINLTRETIKQGPELQPRGYWAGEHTHKSAR